jgi:hypothetical protein
MKQCISNLMGMGSRASHKHCTDSHNDTAENKKHK